MKSAIAAACITIPLFLAGCSKTPDEIFIDGMVDYIHIIVENNGKCEDTVKKLDKFVNKRADKMGLALAAMVKNASRQVTDNTAQSPLQLIADEIEFYLSEEEYQTALNPTCANDDNFKAAQARFGETLLKPVFKEMAGDVGKAIENGLKSGN